VATAIAPAGVAATDPATAGSDGPATADIRAESAGVGRELGLPFAMGRSTCRVVVHAPIGLVTRIATAIVSPRAALP
jgi:hypothetical protein